jgi:hypothetical protein
MSNDKNFDTNKLLKDFGVKTEDDLLNTLDKESKTLPCIICGNEFSFDELSFPDGDPICRHCSGKENNGE